MTVGSAGAAAQRPVAVPPPAPLGPIGPPSASVTEVDDSLFSAGKHEEALDYLEGYLKAHPTDYVAEKLAAREALVLAIAQSASNADSAKQTFRRAISHGKRATAMDSLDEDSRYYTMAAEGRLGLLGGGPSERAHAAVEVDKAARGLLKLDSLNAGAHNALGRLYFEIASLSWVERLFARPLLGGDLISRSNWESAEKQLRRAVQLDPRRNLYLVDLGALLMKRKHFEEARTVLDSAVDLPLEFAGEELFRDRARHLLDEIARQTGSADPAPGGR